MFDFLHDAKRQRADRKKELIKVFRILAMNKNRQIIGELQEFFANNDASKGRHYSSRPIQRRLFR